MYIKVKEMFNDLSDDFITINNDTSVLSIAIQPYKYICGIHWRMIDVE